MKKILILATSALLLLAGCAKEESGLDSLAGDMQTVTFTAGIPSEIITKAAFDNDGNGALVNRCIMEIYYGNALFSRQYAKVTDKQASFTTQLVANRTYKVAFWADCVADPNTDDGLAADRFYTTNATGGLQAVAIKGSYAGNSDARDAFALCKEYTVSQQGGTFSAVLRRPFAQINVITTDVATVAKIDGLKPDQVSLILNNAVTSYNVIDSTAVSGATDDLTYTANVYNWDADTTACTLSMDYIFAEKTKGVIDIAWNAKHGTDTDVSHSFTNIPYQRNYRTNIKGALLTTTGQWNVTVDPEWATPDTNILIVSATVDDIDGMNDFVAAHPEAHQYDVTFSSIPNDAGTPDGTSGSAAHSILTTPLGSGDVMNIAVETDAGTLYVGDFQDQNSTALSSKLDTVKAATVNINVPTGKKITTLVINAPSKSVYLNGQLVASAGTLTNVESTTSQNTLVIQAGQSIGTLTVHQGGLEIHGSVTALVISEDAHDTNPVKVRACENLSADVFAVIKSDSHDYIDRPAYIEQQNGETWDIVPSVCMINNVGYSSVAAALAAVGDGETIVMLQDDVLTKGQTITLENNEALTLDLNGKTISIAETGFDFSANGTKDELRSGVPKRFAIVVNGNGTFNICDSSAGALGTITAPDHDYGTVKAILVDGNAIVNVNSGNICGGYSAFYAIGYTGTDPVDPATAPKPTLNINGGKVLGGSNAIGIKGNTAKLSISAGVVESTGYYGVVTNGTQDWYDGGNSCITISGGTIKGTTGAAMYLPAESPTTITGGYFEGTEGIVVKGGSLTITGASVVINATGAYGEPGSGGSGYETTGSCIYVEDTYSGHTPVVNISAGKFSSANNQAVQYYTTKEAGAEDKGYVSLTGGTYSSLPADDCIASGYKAVANGTKPETWTVESSPVCKIGITYYNTLAEAIAAVPTTGEETTIQMIAKHDLGEFTGNKIEIPSTVNIILDLNGKTISGTGNGGVASYLFWNKGTLKIVDTAGDGTITYSSTTPDGSYGYGTSTILNRGILEIASGHIVNTTSGGASYAVDNQTLWWDEIIPVEFTLSGTANIECTTGDAGLRQAIACGGYSKGGQPIINNVNIKGGTITGDFWIQVLNSGSVGNLSITGGTITGPVYNTTGDVTNVTYSISGGVFQGTHKDRGSISLQGKSGFITGGTFSTNPTASYIASGYVAEAQGTTPETWTVKKFDKSNIEVSSLEELNSMLASFTEAGDYVYKLPAGDFNGSEVIIKQREGVNVTIAGSTTGVTNLSQAQISIDGMGRWNEAETVTIKGIKFDYSEYSSNTSISIIQAVYKESTTGHLYSHNITIDSCTFIGNSSKRDKITAIQPTAGGGHQNWTIKNCTAEYVHSLSQMQSVSGVTITGCTLTNCGRGVNLQSSTDVVISGKNNWTVEKYVIRAGQGSGSNIDTEMKIYDNTFTRTDTESGEEGCLVLRAACPNTIIFCDNTISTYDGFDVCGLESLPSETIVKTDKSNINVIDHSDKKITVVQGSWDKINKEFTPAN